MVLAPEEQLEILRRGTVEIISEEELMSKLRRSRETGEPLRVKLGLDPSAPDIHLGHTVVLRKLRQFQDLGHQVFLLVGDFTGRIGDPSGRSETRRQLSEEEVRANAETYARQVYRILDPERTHLVFNSSWLSPLTFADVLRLASRVTVAQLLVRDDFQARYREGRPIFLHEFFYPLMQAYDSVALEADVELGGTDQKFNLLMAREIQREYGQEPEVAVITPILEGLDGVQKMSKSLGNYVALEDPPREMYGKLMSLPDHLIGRYFLLLTGKPEEEIGELEREMAEGRTNPRDVKMLLAREIVTSYHGAEAAVRAEEEFIRVFREGGVPDEIPEFPRLPGKVWLPRLLVDTGLCPSTSEARRKIAEGAVRLDGERPSDPDLEVELRDGLLLRVGKRRVARIRLLT